jgi:YidC/Oxa1 family membrane protein insertase
MLHAIFVQPLTNLLFFFVAYLPGHDFGIAIILLTAFIRLILWPLASKQLHSQKALTAIQPEVNRLKEKYKNDPTKFNQATMELYKEKEVNPFSSCLPLLIQLPFLIGIFYVFRPFALPAYADLSNPHGIVGQLYPFVKNLPAVKSYISSTAVVSTMFLGFVDLAKSVGKPISDYIPNLVLAALAAAAQFVQSKMLLPKKDPNAPRDPSAAISAQMTYFFPVMTFAIAFTLPSALPLYWLVTTLFAILQQYLVFHHDIDQIEEEAAIETERKPKKVGKHASKRK